MFAVSLVFALFLSSFYALKVDFVLRYDVSCQVLPNNGFNCTGKAGSQDIKTTISGKGDVATTINKLKGSISNYDAVKLNDHKSELGTLSFGVHQTAKDHTLRFSATSERVGKDIYSGVMKFIGIFFFFWFVEFFFSHSYLGGTGAFKNAWGVGSLTCQIAATPKVPLLIICEVSECKRRKISQL